MFRKSLAVAVILFAGSLTPAVGQNWAQTADPQVVQALNELVQVYGGYCQQGNPQACQMVQEVQNHGGAMMNAGYDCQAMGNQQACAWYRNAYAMLEQTYAQTVYALQQGQLAQPGGGGGGVNPLGATHEDRMLAIQNWGQERLQWGQDRSNMMEQSHENFMNTLRN